MKPTRTIACILLALAAGPGWSADADTVRAAGKEAAPPVRAAAGAVPGDRDAITLNFVNSDIEGVVKAVSEITGRNFVVDPRVKGTVNIISARPMPRSLVYPVFLSVLRLQGYAAIEERGFVKIVPETDAKLHDTQTVGPKDRARAAGDQIETRIFMLKYESAAQLVPVLRPLIAPNNTINAYPSANALVITDYAGNLQRLQRVIDSIDQPGGQGPAIIPLLHASAIDAAQALNRLFAEAGQAQGAPGGDPSQQFVIVPDTRSNSLMVRSGNPARLAHLRTLAAALDSPTGAAGNFHVLYLKNAEAVRVAETLRALYQGTAAPPSSGTPLSPPAPAGAQGPGAPPAGAPGLSTVSALQPPGATTLPFSASGNVSPATPGLIQADAATNSIIITAPDPIYNSLRAVVEKLDVRRAQVYVEALVAEITAQKAAEFGIQWQDLTGAAAGNNVARGFGGTSFGNANQNILSLAQNPGLAGHGLNVGVIKGVVSIPGISGQILNMGVLVRALESENNANILSTPTLLTLDNEEARIVIGQNVPFITGQYALTGAATTPTPFQTIERRDVGLTLRIRPQISQGGSVRLQIYQEVSSIQDTSNVAGVITNKRSVESTVLVDDGQIVVLGGLIQDTVNDGVEKVPLLGDIPILGGLFQYRTRSHNKVNLMVFLRPTVVREAGAANAITSDRYDYILRRELQAAPAPSVVLPPIEAPTLPLRIPPGESRPQ